MNIVSKVINRLELEKCKIEQYRVGKKFNATLEEAYEKLEMFSHDPKTSCYRDNKKIIMGGGRESTTYLSLCLFIIPQLI